MTKYALVGDVGGTNARLTTASKGPTVVMMVGLQGLITPASKRSFAFILKNIRSR